MRWLVNTVFFTFFSLGFVSCASSQGAVSKASDVVEIGNGLFLETVPARFITMKFDNDASKKELEWVVIPAVYESITETIILKAAFNKLELTPPVYDIDGTTLKPAKAILKEIPAVTKEVTRRIVKIPPKVVKRIVPILDGELTTRKKIKAQTFIIRDNTGKTLKRYDDPAKVAKYINSR